MSRELPYSPPKTAKWKWNPKALQHYSWSCSLSDQMIAPALRGRGKAEVRLTVDLLEEGYVWSVSIRDWLGKSSEQVGMCQTAEGAVAIAEEAGERRVRELYTPETTKFLGMGWRPPA